jgi:peroxiredoxin (alkyl hydroperoxide reductase subunit C)
MDKLVDHADIIGVSGDNEFCKKAWKESNPALNNIEHILCADSGLVLGHKLGIVDEANGVHYRATFIIDPEGIIQHVSVNALDTGRNADETLRTLQALQAGGLTGCSWTPGDEFVG